MSTGVVLRFFLGAFHAPLFGGTGFRRAFSTLGDPRELSGRQLWKTIGKVLVPKLCFSNVFVAPISLNGYIVVLVFSTTAEPKFV
jgi:hypothetical protein